MKATRRQFRKNGLCLLVSMALAGAFSLANADDIYIIPHEATHVFSIDDVQGGFDGSTYATDPSIICMGGCTGDAQPYEDKGGVMLYPVDSEFGFIVEDFVGAAQKDRNMDHAEGWVGNIDEGGVRAANADTDTFKVTPPLGSWCAGLGSNTVKCSTEHYVVMEHLKTCNETIPYMHADPDTGIQKDLIDPETGFPLVPASTCAAGALDDVLFEVVGGLVTATPLGPDADGFPNLIPNESTVMNDVATNTDYAITKKDDGKALYRWGSMIKRPNDLRFYARMALPDEWKNNPETAYDVTKAELHIDHLITNNPNDQVRPEDMENEGAIGILPEVDKTGDVWTSLKECYEGDGDLIPFGTVFRNPPFAIAVPEPPEDQSGLDPLDPYPYSEDLRHGFTNGWFTTIDRNPFEKAGDEIGQGPRWRLKPNKFGQDLPSLEIPLIECSPVPFSHHNIMYEVGERTLTVLNLLDFEDFNENGDPTDDSPLLTSQGWIDPEGNGYNELMDELVPGLSVNGLPLTEDFDLAVYIKGDNKATSLFSATLYIEYESTEPPDDPPPPEESYDVSLTAFNTPSSIPWGTTSSMKIKVLNAGPETASGTVEFVGVWTDAHEDEFIERSFEDLAAGELTKIKFDWTAPAGSGTETVNWTATVIADGDVTPANNTATSKTIVW